jgi:hypothetical protein
MPVSRFNPSQLSVYLVVLTTVGTARITVECYPFGATARWCCTKVDEVHKVHNVIDVHLPAAIGITGRDAAWDDVQSPWVSQQAYDIIDIPGAASIGITDQKAVGTEPKIFAT